MRLPEPPGKSPVESLVGAEARCRGYRVLVSDRWILVDPPGAELPSFGWKLHLSSRPDEYLRLLDLALPILFDARCVFKVIRSEAQLRRLNSSFAAPSAVGKAITVYPHRGVLHTVAQALVERLAGLAGPRINSDRRLDPAGPVYYRYGHFLPIFLASADGELASVFFDRNGVAHAADAQPKYSAPRYVRDPFSGRRGDRRDQDLSMLGCRYNPA